MTAAGSLRGPWLPCCRRTRPGCSWFSREFLLFPFFFFLKKKKEVGKMFTLFFFFFKALFDRHATERDVKSTSSCLGEKKRE